LFREVGESGVHFEDPVEVGGEGLFVAAEIGVYNGAVFGGEDCDKARVLLGEFAGTVEGAVGADIVEDGEEAVLRLELAEDSLDEFVDVGALVGERGDDG